MARTEKVAYILLHFPYLTETFVAEEIRILRSMDIDVRIVSLLNPGPGPMQPVSTQLLPYTWYAPGILAPSLWRAQIYFLRQLPHIYFRSLGNLLCQPYTKKAIPTFFKRLLVFLKAVSVAYYLDESDIQLLHSHFAWLSGAAANVVSRLLNKPFTVTVHAFDIFSYKNDLLGSVCKDASHVIAISEKNQRHIEALKVCSPKSISVIHCGVNLAEIDKSTQGRHERKEDNLLRILSVGSLVNKKGHTYLIDACNILKLRGQNYQCSIIGDGPEKATLLRKIEAYGLQNHVNLLGALSHPEIMSIYRQYDVFVLASVVSPSGDQDGIPVVLMEAGACGLPLISTNVSGIPELVRQGETGLIVPPKKPDVLADTLNSLAIDKKLRNRLGQNAKALVDAEFNSEINAFRVKTLFDKIIVAVDHIS